MLVNYLQQVFWETNAMSPLAIQWKQIYFKETVCNTGLNCFQYCYYVNNHIFFLLLLRVFPLFYNSSNIPNSLLDFHNIITKTIHAMIDLVLRVKTLTQFTLSPVSSKFNYKSRRIVFFITRAKSNIYL